MTHSFNISLPGFPKFSRVYAVNGKNSLYEFHKQMLNDMDFPYDQVVLFKAFSIDGRLLGRFATFDVGDGSIDDVTIDQVLELGACSFVYFYDTINKKSVNINYEGESESEYDSPTLISASGPNPDAYSDPLYILQAEAAEKAKRMQAEGVEDDDDDDEDEDEDQGSDFYDNDAAEELYE